MEIDLFYHFLNLTCKLYMFLIKVGIGLYKINRKHSLRTSKNIVSKDVFEASLRDVNVCVHLLHAIG